LGLSLAPDATGRADRRIDPDVDGAERTSTRIVTDSRRPCSLRQTEGVTEMAPAAGADAMLLFTGPVNVLRDAPAVAWYGSSSGHYQEPHLVWPEDRAWCLACEVDEEIEFSVGCSDGAARALTRALPGAVRRVRYGAAAPLCRGQ
jgi:hypothetical protein